MAHAVFRVATCLALTVGVAWLRNPLVRWGIILWIAGVAWSVLAAPDPWRALWATHNRQGGAWQTAHSLGLAPVLAAVPRAKLVRWVALGAINSPSRHINTAAGRPARQLPAACNPLYLAPL